MDCKTFEKLIPDFLDDTLDNRTVKETFHLKNELTQTMDNARMTNIRRRKLTYYAYSYEIVTFVAIAAFFIIMAVYF